MNELGFEDVLKAHQRIKNYIIETPVVVIEEINNELNADVFFKLENQQKVNAFKARGAFNAVLSYQEKYKKLPEKIVAQSSGNHAQAIALIGKTFNIPTLIYMAKTASKFKIEASRNLGAEVILCEKRSEANRLAEEKEKSGYFFIHPSGNEDVISGQGTSCFEALKKIGEVDAIFAPCGGGGLVIGCLLASQVLSPKAKIFGCEPLNANDASISVKEGKIFHFEDSPNTIADGARTLAVTELCFHYLKKLSGILEISEEEIIFWQKKLSKHLQEKIETTSALGIAGAVKFLEKKRNEKRKKILVIISGGNLE
jgi:threonine dehydratase